MQQQWINDLNGRLDDFLTRNGAPRLSNSTVSMPSSDFKVIETKAAERDQYKARFETVDKYKRWLMWIALAEAVAILAMMGARL